MSKHDQYPSESASVIPDQALPAAPSGVVLPWDFNTTFPPLLDDPIAAGVLTEDDRDEPTVRAIHNEHAEEGLNLLADLDAAAKADGIDPSTGIRRTDTEESQLLSNRLDANWPVVLLTRLDNLLDAYASYFGTPAATAFQIALQAWHRGVVVVAETCGESLGTDKTQSQLTPKLAGAPTGNQEIIRPTMPCPFPLGDAIQRGVFGHGANGQPLFPDPKQVQSITKIHADRLLELLEAPPVELATAVDTRNIDPGQENARARSTYEHVLNLYADDFGQAASRRLDDWVRNQFAIVNRKRPR